MGEYEVGVHRSPVLFGTRFKFKQHIQQGWESMRSGFIDDLFYTQALVDFTFRVWMQHACPLAR